MNKVRYVSFILLLQSLQQCYNRTSDGVRGIVALPRLTSILIGDGCLTLPSSLPYIYFSIPPPASDLYANPYP